MPSMHLSLFSTIALAGSLTLAGTSVLRADYVHDQAQQSLTQAQNDLAVARARADQAQAALASASAANVDLTSRLNADRQQASTIRERMDRGQAGLREIQAKIESATNIMEAKHREMAVADLPYGSLKFADEQARLDAIKSFNESAEYRAALQAVNDTATALQTTQAESLRRGHHPESDPNVMIAQNRLGAAKAALDALRGNFMEEQLPRIPSVAAADQALGAEQVKYDALSAKAQAAEKELADARVALDRQNAGLAGDQLALGQLTTEITHWEADQATAQAAADQAADDAGRAVAYANAAQQSRDNAVAALQQLDAPQVVQPQTSYEYAPPPVVYAQPGSVYAPGPYYGTVVIVPRGGGYAGGGIRNPQRPVYSHQTYNHGGGHR